MKKFNLNLNIIFINICILFCINSSAQTGLNFQGVARTSNNEIIESKFITLRLSIIKGSAAGNAEYIEIKKVKTNTQGLFTTVIGDTEALSTIGKFSDIVWDQGLKFLKIELDPEAGNNFTTMGITQFQYVAYAKYANTVLAENISGIVPVARGGTGSNSLTALKLSMSLDKVNNTPDSLKPVSKFTQASLDYKLNIADSTKLYVTPTQLSKFNFKSGVINIDTTNLSNRINLKFNIVDTAFF